MRQLPRTTRAKAQTTARPSAGNRSPMARPSGQRTRSIIPPSNARDAWDPRNSTHPVSTNSQAGCFSMRFICCLRTSALRLRRAWRADSLRRFVLRYILWISLWLKSHFPQFSTDLYYLTKKMSCLFFQIPQILNRIVLRFTSAPANFSLVGLPSHVHDGNSSFVYLFRRETPKTMRKLVSSYAQFVNLLAEVENTFGCTVIPRTSEPCEFAYQSNLTAQWKLVSQQRAPERHWRRIGKNRKQLRDLMFQARKLNR